MSHPFRPAMASLLYAFALLLAVGGLAAVRAVPVADSRVAGFWATSAGSPAASIEPGSGLVESDVRPQHRIANNRRTPHPKPRDSRSAIPIGSHADDFDPTVFLR